MNNINLLNNLPGKEITTHEKCSEKSVSFKTTTELINNNKLVKPLFQTDLDEDKVEEMMESFMEHPEFLLFKNKIVIAVTHKNWYVIDGQHRIEMARKLYEKDKINDYFIFCYFAIKNDEEMKLLFFETNKDSYKISKYISLNDFTQNIYDELKEYFKLNKSLFFADKKNKVNNKYTICEFLDKLTENKIFEKFNKVNDLINEIESKNTLFCKKIEYKEYYNDDPFPFYADEKECINDNIIYSLKNNNFIEYLENNNTIPDHIFKNKKYTSPKLIISVWDHYFGNSVTGICIICDKQIKSGKNGFICKPIISYSKGGEKKLENSRPPICIVCDKDMGKKNWDVYIECVNKKKIKSTK